MIFQYRNLMRQKTALFAVTIIFIASCASPQDLTPDMTTQSVQTVPTLTPFQPQLNAPADPFISSALPQPEATYTPYPTQYVVAETLPASVQIISPSEVSSLNINNPLTGLTVSNPSLLQQRPMAIKIANSPDYVRPQSGLTLADVVYEYYIEWGDTRFIAVFYSNNPTMVGPVRSGRYFDEHVTRMYHAFLVFKSADPRELSYLKESDLNDFLVIVGFGGCSPYFKGPYNRDSYNNQFFNTTKWAACAIKKGVDNSAQVLSGGFFTEDVPESALSVSRIFSHYSVYSYNYWEYDPATHKYFRYQEANDMDKGESEAYTALSDAQTNLPVTAENVVVLFVPHIFANTYNAHDEVFNIDLIDFGNAYVFRDGIAIPAIWNRTDKDQPILLTTLDGSPIYMRPGRTFYQVMGTTSTYTQNGSDWRFVFQTP
ncbi:MAG: DUF3048 domain-containing protein [Anaerolineales bacterium]|nr:DUF3048 domain-containing protein [Anaerolineales bacterium]